MRVNLDISQLCAYDIKCLESRILYLEERFCVKNINFNVVYQNKKTTFYIVHLKPQITKFLRGQSLCRSRLRK